MKVSIYYHPEAYTTASPKLMGRHAAGESFLKAFLRYSTAEEIWIQVAQESHGQAFKSQFEELIKNRTVHCVTPGRVSVLSELQACFFPGPGIAKNAQQRTFFNDKAWALTGITHTTASAGAMDEISQLVSSPLQPWDALICTSQSVKTHVERLIQQQLDYFSHRFQTQLQKPPLPMLPVIPLGVHCDDFDTTEKQTKEARSLLGIDRDELIVLFVGRLSFHAKAHPLAMYQALERASQRTGKRVCLLECGWFANDYIEKAFEEAAQHACPSVRRFVLDGRDATKRKQAWAAADIFCSLSDNIQETFGITPIEAMARGIPVVVSDWDGYRETVRHGQDGFRIPTISAPKGLGEDLARRHALEIDTYDMYCGYASSMVAMDIEQAADRFAELLQSDALRLDMGRSGRERARSVFNWPVLLKQYEALWREQNERRQAADRPVALAVPWPSRGDPSDHFAHYPTVTLNLDDVLMLSRSFPGESIPSALDQRLSLAMVKYSQAVMLSQSDLEAILIRIKEQGEVRVEGLLPAATAQPFSGRRVVVYRSLCWLLKLGMIERVTGEPLNPKDIGESASLTSNLKAPGLSLNEGEVLYIAGLGIAKKAGVTEARVDYPLTALARQPNVKVVFSERSLQLPPGFGPGILLLHRQFLNDKASQAQMERLASKGWLLMSDMDDDPHHWPEYVSSDFYAFRGVHAVTVSTEPLAAMVRQWNPNVLVFENQLLELPKLPDCKLSDCAPPEGPLRIFFGALNRWEDWKWIQTELLRAAVKHASSIEFVVVHDEKVFKSIPDNIRKAFHPTSNHSQYMALLSQCDISLLPLRDTSFNRLKSDLKFIESAGSGAVPIFSPTVYASSSVHGMAGVLAESPKDWGVALETLITKPAELIKRRVAGLGYVKTHRLYEHTVSKRAESLKALLAGRETLETARLERIATWQYKTK